MPASLLKCRAAFVIVPYPGQTHEIVPKNSSLASYQSVALGFWARFRAATVAKSLGGGEPIY